MDAATHEAAVTMVSALLANIQMLSVLLSDEPDATIVQALLNGAASALGEPERPGARMIREFGENLRDRLPGVLARRHCGQFRVRMRQQQPYQFFARVTGRADDGDIFHSYQFFAVSHWPLNCTCDLRGKLTADSGWLTAPQTKNPARLNQQGLEISSAINASKTGSVCARPAGRIFCARACAGRV